MGAILPLANGQTKQTKKKTPAPAVVEDDGLQHHKYPCGADYERIRTHKPGDSPAMWHEYQKSGEIKRTKNTITVAGQSYDVGKGIIAGILDFIYEDADWKALIVHKPSLDYIYIIESENCPYAGIED